MTMLLKNLNDNLQPWKDQPLLNDLLGSIQANMAHNNFTLSAITRILAEINNAKQKVLKIEAGSRRNIAFQHIDNQNVVGKSNLANLLSVLEMGTRSLDEHLGQLDRASNSHVNRFSLMSSLAKPSEPYVDQGNDAVLSVSPTKA